MTSAALVTSATLGTQGTEGAPSATEKPSGEFQAALAREGAAASVVVNPPLPFWSKLTTRPLFPPLLTLSELFFLCLSPAIPDFPSECICDKEGERGPRARTCRETGTAIDRKSVMTSWPSSGRLCGTMTDSASFTAASFAAPSSTLSIGRQRSSRAASASRRFLSSRKL